MNAPAMLKAAAQAGTDEPVDWDAVREQKRLRLFAPVGRRTPEHVRYCGAWGTDEEWRGHERHREPWVTVTESDP